MTHLRTMTDLPSELETRQPRKTEEPLATDAQDEADLKALENALKNRPKL